MTNKKCDFLFKSNPKRAQKARERYANDPQARAKKIAAQKRWNAAHPSQKRANDQRWAKKHGAAAAKRYRARKKAQENANGQ